MYYAYLDEGEGVSINIIYNFIMSYQIVMEGEKSSTIWLGNFQVD